MDDTSVDYDARMAALAAAFAQALPEKRRALQADWRAWQEDGVAAARDALQAQAHRLGGAADNYGYVALGCAARALDALLVPRLGAQPAAVADAVAALIAAFEQPPEAD